MFENMNSDGLEQSQDRLGGYSPLESDIHTGTVKAFYAGKSDGGATFVSLILDLGNKSEYRETYYVTNKKGENFYPNKQDPTKKIPLPGFTVVDDICLVTAGQPLAAQTTEEKVINIWNSETKKEEPKSVPMLMDVVGKQVSLGILKELVNKTVKQGNEYVPTAETREQNVTDKVFHTETKMTVPEAREGKTAPAFWDGWIGRNQGKTRDRTAKGGQAGQAGAPQRPTPNAATAAARPSLFGKS